MSDDGMTQAERDEVARINALPHDTDVEAQLAGDTLSDDEFDRAFMHRMPDGSFIDNAEYEARQAQQAVDEVAALDDQRKFNEWAATQPARPEYPKS